MHNAFYAKYVSHLCDCLHDSLVKSQALLLLLTTWPMAMCYVITMTWRQSTVVYNYTNVPMKGFDKEGTQAYPMNDRYITVCISAGFNKTF